MKLDFKKFTIKVKHIKPFSNLLMECLENFRLYFALKINPSVAWFKA
jgi:hypothetical protein